MKLLINFLKWIIFLNLSLTQDLAMKNCDKIRCIDVSFTLFIKVLFFEMISCLATKDQHDVCLKNYSHRLFSDQHDNSKNVKIFLKLSFFRSAWCLLRQCAAPTMASRSPTCSAMCLTETFTIVIRYWDPFHSHQTLRPYHSHQTLRQ